MKVFQFSIVLICILFLQNCGVKKDLGQSHIFRGNGHAQMQACFENNNVITIPDGVHTVNGDLHLNGNKTLIINGTLKGVKGNERIFTDGDVVIQGKGTFERFSFEIKGGSFNIEDVKMLRPGKSAAILINNDNKVVTDLRIVNVEITKGPYGIFRQGAYGEKPVLKGLIKNCYIHDCRGDGIEWNVGDRDGSFTIENNRIENLNSDKGGPVGKAWGIGIGVAGGPCNDKYENYVKNFKIVNNIVSNVRQGIHIESGSDFIISGNKVDINPKQSTKGTLEKVAIVTYCCADFEISNNQITAHEGFAIWNSFGSLPKIGYLTPPKNYSINNNVIKGVVRNWCSGKNNTVEVYDNKINGNLVHFGAGIHKIQNNEIETTSDKPAIKVDFFFNGKGKRKNYNALKKDAKLVEENNTSSKKSVSLKKSIKIN